MLKTIQGNGLLLSLEGIKIMGIVNATPDSFYTHDVYTDLKGQQSQVSQMIAEGVDILDIGAVSTRPGAEEVGIEEEWKRLLPLLKWVRQEFPQVFISVDTFRSEIVKRAYDEGINMVNDISAGKYDDQLWKTVGELQLPYVLMHMQGDPQNMQDHPHYDDISRELMDYFMAHIRTLTQHGIQEVIIDPGFGFGKTMTHNYELLKNLSDFKLLSLPLMVGMSRKSMIYKYLEIKPTESLNGTSILNTYAALHGAKIFRVHDVKEAKEMKLLLNQLA
ncbi:MAG TPA: dihydropteroate synthase [Chitinophagaceae bacterium]|nr:dihydropteroate synthase [Chitinophagaceae bacterium]